MDQKLNSTVLLNHKNGMKYELEILPHLLVIYSDGCSFSFFLDH